MKSIVVATLLVSSLFFLIGCSDANKNQNVSAKDETIQAVVAGLIADAKTDEQKIEKIL